MSKKRILFFTDIHFGIHGNNQKYLDICRETMKWLGVVCKEHGVTSILFGGDYFDSRSSIDVKTMNVATESLYELAENVNKINMILGNHDIYLRDSTSIHSLLAYGGHDRIKIIDKPAIFDKTILILPWGFDGSSVSAPTNEVKFVFCHNDFPRNFFFNYGKGKSFIKSSKSDTNTLSSYKEEFGIDDGLMKTVIENDGHIISGHIHQSQKIPLSNGGADLIIAGSPFETEYGFGESKCGAYVIDIEDGTIEFFENPCNKKHLEICTSNIDEDLKKGDIFGNFVRLKVDTQEPFDVISSIQQKLIRLKPYHIFNTIFDFESCPFSGKRDTTQNPLNQSINDGAVVGVSSKLDYIVSAIDKADFSEFVYTDSNGNRKMVDKADIKNIASEIYGKVCK